MTATVRVYKSTDTSAPSLNGSIGTLITVLDAVLVNGYGSTVAAGWTKPFTGTNLAAYLPAAGTLGGTMQPYLRVDDSVGQEARVVAYETMSAISTGGNTYPTSAQISGGGFVRKSGTADTIVRPWTILATERLFYMFIDAGQTVWGNTDTTSVSWSFGVFQSYKSGDAYNGQIVLGAITGSGSGRLGTMTSTPTSSTYPGATVGHYMARAYTQTGTAINFSKGYQYCGTTAGITTGFVYPDPITGSLRLSRVLVWEPDNGGVNFVERGYMPGMWGIMHSNPASYFDTFSGTGDLAGKSFIIMPTNSLAVQGKAAFETTGSWGL